MRNGITEDRDEDFAIRLVDENTGNFSDPRYKPKDLEEVWENIENYINLCDRDGRECTLKTAMEYTDTPFWIFSDNRTSELIKLYFSMKQNPMFLYGNIENTPNLWIESVAILNTMWQT